MPLRTTRVRSLVINPLTAIDGSLYIIRDRDDPGGDRKPRALEAQPYAARTRIQLGRLRR